MHAGPRCHRPRRSSLCADLLGDHRESLGQSHTFPSPRDTGQAVSEKSFEPILRALDAVNRRDAEAFVATARPDIEWEDANYWTEVSRTYRGKVEVREPFNGAVAEPWESLHCEVEEITAAADDRVFFGVLLTARGRDSMETQLHFWSVCWSADGKVTRRAVFRERADALEAPGCGGRRCPKRKYVAEINRRAGIRQR
jgi:ketosteroid isomerase-like protein